MGGTLMAIAIVFARGCLPCVVPYRATGLNSPRHSWSSLQRWPGKGLFHPIYGNGTTWVRSVLGTPISRSTVWRILDTDAIKPWRYKYWIFPRDPHFVDKAGPILDLYAGRWQGQPLGPKDHILSADEKTSIQARRRCHPALPPAPSRAAYIENESERGGPLQY